MQDARIQESKKRPAVVDPRLFGMNSCIFMLESCIQLSRRKKPIRHEDARPFVQSSSSSHSNSLTRTSLPPMLASNLISPRLPRAEQSTAECRNREEYRDKP